MSTDSFLWTSEIEDSKVNILYILAPYNTSKMDVYNFIIKYADIISQNHYMVTIGKNNNPNNITYEQLQEYHSKFNDKFFFIDNIEFFYYYSSEDLYSSNKFIFLIDIFDIMNDSVSKLDKNIIEKFNSRAVFYPKNLSMDLRINYKKNNTYIMKEQLSSYKKSYLKYISAEMGTSKEMPENILNVYYDKIISSLEGGISLESCLNRAPKFKNILIELLINNKKRHLVKLPNNKYGIDAFISVYNKLNHSSELTVIKSSDNFNKKETMIKKFNSTNGPGIILTDYNFSGSLIPKNINQYHISNGGEKEDFITILDCIKSSNNNSAMNNDFLIINHLSSTLKGEYTVNELNEINFKETFDKTIEKYTRFIDNGFPLFLEGDDLMFASENKSEEK